MLAGGTFLGILMNQGFLAPERVPVARPRPRSSSAIDVVDGELRLGAMVTHRRVEREVAAAGRCSRARSAWWPARACATRRRSAACWPTPTTPRDPPAMLAALDARAVLRSPRGDRAVSVGELILGYYETCIEPDELLVEVRVPPQPERATYRKFRSRSSEDRPCAAVAAVQRRRRAARGGRRGRGDAAGLPGPVRRGAGRDRPRGYAERIEPLSDSRGSAALPAPGDRGRGAPGRGGR